MTTTVTDPKSHATKNNPSASSSTRGALLIQPYLMFGGRCDEALDFYKRALGAEVTMLMRFKDAPPPPAGEPNHCGPLPAGVENKVMHASFRVGATEVLASDGCETTSNFQGFSLSLTAQTPADADRFFAALSEGGNVQMPLAKTFFADRFGMVADKFGVSWMLFVPKAAS
jgi:PhnB protein